MGDRDGSPSLPRASATTGRMRKGWKVRSPPAGDEEKLRLRIGPVGRGAGRASPSCAKRGVPRGSGDAKGDWSKKGRGRKRNPSSDWDLHLEATPELVSQDRGAGDLRVGQADEHRRILRSAQMGAGSNAGPHFSFGAMLWVSLGELRVPGRALRSPRRALATRSRHFLLTRGTSKPYCGAVRSGR